MAELTHRRGCSPLERTSTSCPCGAVDAYRDHLDRQAEDIADRHERERDER